VIVSRVSLLCAGLLLALACSKLSAKREVSEDDSEEVEQRPRKPRRSPSAGGLVFEPEPTAQPGAPAPRPKLTLEPLAPTPLAPTPLPPPALPPEIDFLSSGASRIVPLIEQRVPRPRFAEVVVRHDRVDVDVITGPDAVQEYQLKGDVVTDRGLDEIKSRRGRELQRAAFGPADVAWAKLPGVAKDAKARLAALAISHVHVERPLPFSQDVQIRVFTEERGWVDYDAQGRFREIHPVKTE
jgi:hypothetical protein